jgi:glycosyltransferase involved in cell wall biosynthesis
MSSPQVSVVIPTYRRPHLVGRAVRSVLAQEGVTFDVVVVDDEPSEETAAVIGAFGDDRVRYIAHDANCGLSAARNTGIMSSAAPYVAFLDDDDEFLPGRLRLQYESLEAAADDVGVASCYEEVVSPDGGRRVVRAFDLDGDVLGEFLENDIVHAQMLMVRRRCFDDVGLFDEQLRHHEDFDMSIRLARRHRFVTVREPLLRMYRADAKLSKNVPNRVAALERIIEKTPEIRDDGELRARWMLKLARLSWSAGRRRDSVRWLGRSLRRGPVPVARVLASRTPNRG